ncbi:peptide deformylase [Myxococcus phage Mx1]|nr:peptide deformylase [Myxococcus phage Mx1]
MGEENQGVAMPVLQWPHPILKKKAAPVVTDVKTDRSVQTLLADMEATLLTNRAAGLAAPQVGVSLRVIVVYDVPTGSVLKMVNPSIVPATNGPTLFESEGCLSFVGTYTRVSRHAFVHAEYIDEDGEHQQKLFVGPVARAIQHEIDHLDGKTFLDRVSRVERESILQKNKQSKRRVKKVLKSLLAQDF